MPAVFDRHQSPRRLRRVLTLWFIALCVPTGVLVWQAYDQLRWESWYQHRNEAEALVERIDFALEQRVGTAEARSFDDYAFLNGAGGVLRPSPLSAFPPLEDIPGVLGYFQVDPDGRFSTPLLPPETVPADQFGIDGAELAERQTLAAAALQILAENQLVRTTPARETRAQEEPDIEEIVGSAVSVDRDRAEFEAPADPDPAVVVLNESFRSLADAPPAAVSPEQQAFDRLNQPALQETSGGRDAGAATPAPALASRARGLGKVEELALDDDLEQKSEALKRQLVDERLAETEGPDDPPSRARRVEQSVLPAAPAEADLRRDEPLRVTTFESEIDPYQFSLLDSGHGVLYRNAWRDGARYIQGILIDSSGFSQNIIETSFQTSSLAGMSTLIMGYEDDIIRVVRGNRDADAYSGAGDLEGALLYRARLSPPFERLELILSIETLPPGPGATVLGWTTMVIAIVFTVGFWALYRLGVSQIRLAQQQQDFVSAVSHELKTPLTSIRMYGEMLKEGWTDEEKRRQYYDYIHDESERLTRLISNVLQLAKMTRESPQVTLRPIDMRQLVDLLQSKIAGHVSRAGYELDMRIDDDVSGLAVQLDEDCISQVIINLVDNAIKFSRDAERQRIEIRVRKDSDNHVVIAVRDFGPGIPKDQLKKIFRLFYRSESELTRETVGTGIGLAIVHQLTSAMGGSVDVINRDPGAEFRLLFPAS
jgi:signal transduction histidine kinase